MTTRTSVELLRKFFLSHVTAHRDDVWWYLLGICGWILLILNYPFDWQLPSYAVY